jgi:hypothetical protein
MYPTAGLQWVGVVDWWNHNPLDAHHSRLICGTSVDESFVLHWWLFSRSFSHHHSSQRSAHLRRTWCCMRLRVSTRYPSRWPSSTRLYFIATGEEESLNHKFILPNVFHTISLSTISSCNSCFDKLTHRPRVSDTLVSYFSFRQSLSIFVYFPFPFPCFL